MIGDEARWAYDLDGVLAEAPPAHEKPWRRMTGPERQEHRERVRLHYANAKRLYHPHQSLLVVITARSRDAERATRYWLATRFPDRKVGLYMLDGPRDIPRVVEFKSRVLDELRITDYLEDNRTVVRELRKRCPRTRVWHYKDGNMRLDYREAPL